MTQIASLVTFATEMVPFPLSDWPESPVVVSIAARLLAAHKPG